MSNKCPLCEVGNTSSREVDSVRFKECDYCGIEFTDMEDMLYNKETYERSVTMDKTNRIVKICRRLEEIEYILECKDSLPNEEDALLEEKCDLEEELENLQPTS